MRHVVALSGGWDSTAMAILLQEREPRTYEFVCTPTGDEMPAMFEFWRYLGEVLGSPILPIMYRWRDRETGMVTGGLNARIAHYNSLPNRRQRWCTRELKIEPFRQFLAEATPATSYVGLRADEMGRAGGAYADIPGVIMDFPLRRWAMDRAAVVATLEQRGLIPPERTDCARCYHQQIGEWWVLWREHPDLWTSAEIQEEKTGHTFRSPKLDVEGNAIMVERWGMRFAASWRDTWPVRLIDMRSLFEAGHIPRTAKVQRDLMHVGACRVCSL